MDEAIEPLVSRQVENVPAFYYRYENGNPVSMVRPVITVIDPTVPGGIASHRQGWKAQPFSSQSIKPDQSILAQRSDPDTYPTLSFLADTYAGIKIYRHFDVDGLNPLRIAQRPDLPDDFLEESGRNLSIILNDLQHRGVMPTIVERMQAVYNEVDSITVKISGGTVQTFIRERGLRDPIPAARLSDGTLRYLCLLAILYHPVPPPLVCLEEPEVGLHPDLISTLADILMEASERMQIVVTTRSDLLVTALGTHPEAIIVCERDEKGSQLKRLDPARLEKWLRDDSLGELWRSGEIGGVRY